MYRIWALVAIWVAMLSLFACNGGKKKVAGGIIDETETDFKVSGVLIDKQQKPFANRVVYLNEVLGAELRDTTDSAGYFEFETVRPGLWYLVAFDTAQGLLQRVAVDSQNVDLATSKLNDLKTLVLIRDEQPSDTVFIIQLHRLIIMESDTVTIEVPQGEYDIVASDDMPECPTQLESEQVGVSCATASSTLSASSLGMSSSAMSALELSSTAITSFGLSSVGTSSISLSSAMLSSLSLSSVSISSSSSMPILSSSVSAATSSSGFAKGPVTLRYLFTDLVPTKDSSANNLELTVSYGAPMFQMGTVSFYANSCITTPYLQGMFGSYNRMDVRLRLKGTDTGVQGIFCNEDGMESGDMFCLRRRGLDTLEFKFKVSVNPPDSIAIGDVAQNTWMTFSAEVTPDNTATLYLDGVSVASQPIQRGFYGAFNTNNRIGCRNETAADPQYFYGDIDSVRSQIL